MSEIVRLPTPVVCVVLNVKINLTIVSPSSSTYPMFELLVTRLLFEFETLLWRQGRIVRLAA